MKRYPLLVLITLTLALSPAARRATAQTDLPAVPAPEAAPQQPAPQTQPDPTQPNPTEPAAPVRPQQTQLPTCPPGQFPSAFSDVLPTHWAYQAVLNLAATPIRCFDLPAGSNDA